MRIQARLAILRVPFLVATLIASASTFAMQVPINNGDFEGYMGDTNSFNSEVPAGWAITSETPDVFNGSTNFVGYTWAPSGSGGDFVHAIGMDAFFNESFEQVNIGGLEVGKQYKLSFEQSIASWDRMELGSGFWQIIFGGESQFSDILTPPSFGVFDGWVSQELVFTATLETQDLEIIARSVDPDLRADLGIDGISLSTVPEPAPLILIALGLIGIMLRRNR